MEISPSLSSRPPTQSSCRLASDFNGERARDLSLKGCFTLFRGAVAQHGETPCNNAHVPPPLKSSHRPFRPVDTHGLFRSREKLLSSGDLIILWKARRMDERRETIVHLMEQPFYQKKGKAMKD